MSYYCKSCKKVHKNKDSILVLSILVQDDSCENHSRKYDTKTEINDWFLVCEKNKWTFLKDINVKNLTWKTVSTKRISVYRKKFKNVLGYRFRGGTFVCVENRESGNELDKFLKEKVNYTFCSSDGYKGFKFVYSEICEK